ncbi:ICMT-domain-containing protein [Atractiella rhizophila]|nr:ICMT-domain-containing protein [Atractiella rhizophila]
MSSPNSTPPPTPGAPKHPESTVSHSALLRPRPRIPLTSFESTPHNLAWIAFSLGSVFLWGLSTVFREIGAEGWLWFRLGFYAMCWSSFHMLEFTMTSMYCPSKLSVDSFLLNNGNMYLIAHSLSIFELVLEELFLPASLAAYKHGYLPLAIGVVSTVVGQYFRSMAMYTAASSFSHTLAVQKLPSHRLVTDGIYAWTRHPSYVGFWYWCLGLQVFCGNWICLAAFTVILYRYFSNRVEVEEEYLVSFFGKDYVEYRKKVPTRLPFIR